MKKLTCLFILSIFLLGACNDKKQNASNDTPEKQLTTVRHADWTRSAVIYEVNIRQYTQEGTFKAFQKYLPQLKELGVDILWFMPIHPISEKNKKGTLGSYYAVRDYMAVNPEFGTPEEFGEMVKEAHAMGFKVIIDWVANHTGGDNVWTEQHPEWYVRDSVGGFVSPYDWTDTYKLDYENRDMRAGMLDAMKYWVTEYDIDGYRCDVAYEVPLDFWENTRKELDSIKPVFMLAEAEHPELTLNAFDAVYNWALKDILALIAKGDRETTLDHNSGVKANISNGVAAGLDRMFAQQDSVFPTDAFQMNHITNHDLNSWDGSEFERFGEAVQAFAVLTYTINGMPLIYTGQEVGYDHRIEFFEKDPVKSWKKNEMFVFYQKLNELKHAQRALRSGTEGGAIVRYETISPDAYVFERAVGDSRVVVFLNLSKNDISLEYKESAPAGDDLTDYFTGKSTTFPSGLKAWEYKVFVK